MIKKNLRNKKLTLELCQEVAKNRGGMCLSDIYKNANSKMLWRCGEGHTWENTIHRIKDFNQWCPYCAKNVPLGLDECKKIAKLFSGFAETEERCKVTVVGEP